MKYIFFLSILTCQAADLTTPVSVLPPVNHSASGIVRLYDQNKTNYKELRYESLTLDTGSTFIIQNQAGVGKQTFHDSAAFVNYTNTGSGITASFDNAGGNYAIYATKSSGAATPVVRVEQNSNSPGISSVNAGSGPGITAQGSIAFQSAGDTTPSATLSFNLGGSSFYWNNEYISNLIGPSNVITSTTFNPSVDATFNLGSGAAQWKDLNMNGSLTNAALGGGGTLCLHVNNAGTVSAAAGDCAAGGSGSVTSISTTSPITGGTITTTGTIACATCVTTNTSQTISGQKTISSDLLMSANILRTGTGKQIGTTANPFAAVIAENLQTSDLTSGATYTLKSLLFVGRNNLFLTDPVGTNILIYDVPGSGNPLFEFKGDVIPQTTATYDLGKTGNRWNDLFTKNGTLTSALTLDWLAGGGARCLTVDNVGVTGAASCAGGGTVTNITTTSPVVGGTITTTGDISCPTCVTTNTGQTISGLKTFSIGIAFDTDNVYTIGSSTNRVLLESSSVIVRNSSGSARRCAMRTADIQCVNAAAAQVFQVTSDFGQIQSAVLAGAGVRCLTSDNSGFISVAGGACGLVTSVGGTSPISSSGGTTPTVSCPTCVVTVTATSPVSSSGGTSPNITCPTCVSSVTGSSPISSSGGTSPAISCAICVTTTGIQTITGAKTFTGGTLFSSSMQINSAGTFTVGGFGGAGSILINGSNGNFYNRAFAGNGISCAGVADGWMGWDTSGHGLLLCAGGARFKVDLTAY